MSLNFSSIKTPIFSNNNIQSYAQTNEANNLNKLPPEILDIIFKTLSKEEQSISSLVCKEWNTLISDIRRAEIILSSEASSSIEEAINFLSKEIIFISNKFKENSVELENVIKQYCVTNEVINSFDVLFLKEKLDRVNVLKDVNGFENDQLLLISDKLKAREINFIEACTLINEKLINLPICYLRELMILKFPNELATMITEKALTISRKKAKANLSLVEYEKFLREDFGESLRLGLRMDCYKIISSLSNAKLKEEFFDKLANHIIAQRNTQEGIPEDENIDFYNQAMLDILQHCRENDEDYANAFPILRAFCLALAERELEITFRLMEDMAEDTQDLREQLLHEIGKILINQGQFDAVLHEPRFMEVLNEELRNDLYNESAYQLSLVEGEEVLEGIWELINQITNEETKKTCLYNICDNYIENKQFDRVRQICESDLSADFRDELMQRISEEADDDDMIMEFNPLLEVSHLNREVEEFEALFLMDSPINMTDEIQQASNSPFQEARETGSKRERPDFDEDENPFKRSKFI